MIFFYGLPLDARGALNQPTAPYWEFYDLRNDPNEMNNLIADPNQAKTIAELRARLAELKKQVGDTDDEYPELREMWGE